MSAPLYIHGARLIDGSGAPPPSEPYALLVDGQRIIAVAPARALPCPPGARPIDAAGMSS